MRAVLNVGTTADNVNVYEKICMNNEVTALHGTLAKFIEL